MIAFNGTIQDLYKLLTVLLTVSNTYAQVATTPLCELHLIRHHFGECIYNNTTLGSVSITTP